MGYRRTFYISIFVLSTILIMAILSNGVKSFFSDKTLLKPVVLEGLVESSSEISSDNTQSKPIKINSLDESFCEPSKYSLIDIDKKCKNLSDKNCSLVSCCVFLNGEKCVGGSSSGPTYLSVNGENIDVKYYRHKSKVFKSI